jgi:hypothetical protein
MWFQEPVVIFPTVLTEGPAQKLTTPAVVTPKNQKPLPGDGTWKFPNVYGTGFASTLLAFSKLA